MDNQIIIEVKNVYGEVKYYPFNEQAQRVANMFGQRTLTERNLKALIDMGFEVSNKPAPQLTFSKGQN